MNWIYLIIAGIFEVFWAYMMKLSHGFTKINFTVFTILGMLVSFILLAKATKTLPLSIAYPVWTGIGAIGSILVGFFIFGDKISPITWVFIILLLISIIGIKITTSN
ncbi:multidrug efflux SMR transporter [Companilactobacillus allii]|uniref:QacE family quaternary ammonium compound efflux SMR transporter n=1 Tax=Companilactobacillus allii TaxID=1847728 RepID=A0A1P8Q601_9LACO|nr:multidrug efflux SMR transporter [Companilactobacillus allii]APX73287.1 QacE family quaternary ammonium compound efflux SMR transporter [Companilactobacillus allii]USQ68101.1 multidrug efflux SMR transporter [Companilactobacillus allii]